MPFTVGQLALGICRIVGNPGISENCESRGEGAVTYCSNGVDMDIIEGVFLVQIFLGEIFLGKNFRLDEHDVKELGTYTPDLASTLSVS